MTNENPYLNEKYRENVEVGDAQIEKFNNSQYEIAERLANSPEVAKIIKEIDVGNPESVLTFGQGAANEISKFSDKILQETSKNTVEESGKMLKDLANIMKQFDPQDFADEEKKKGILGKLFGKVNNSIEKILNKYKTMDGDIQNVYVQIKQYEDEIKKANGTMETMYDKNIEYYEELEKYIYAGNQIKEQTLTQWIPQLEEKARQTNDPRDLQTLNDARDFYELMDQRIQDLEMAKMVSIQTAPQIKMIQKGNHNLMRKINSAFVVTLPTFKIGLTQAITMKRQRIQADALKALDDTTNEMLLRNAQNISQNSIDITRLAGDTSVKIETLQQTFDTIMRGIEETMAIQEENTRKREENRTQLIELQKQLKEKNF